MPIVISQSLVLSQVQEFPPWSPVIGWHNLVTADNIEAETEADGFPAQNMATNVTAERWQAASTAAQRIVVTPDYVGEIDYIAVARHNFGTAKIAVTVEGYTDFLEDGVTPDWFTLVDGYIPKRDTPLIFRFQKQALVGVSLSLAPGITPARAAVLYVGKLLILPPHIQPGFTPPPYGREFEFASDFTQSGEYLGNLVISKSVTSSMTLPYLDPDWYREEMDPFMEVIALQPFFFAWDPHHYPEECGFVCVTPGSNPKPDIHQVTGEFTITLDMRGIA